MADNRVSNPGAGGATWVVAEFVFSGDTAGAPGTFCGILAGSEGAWTYTLQPGGAGAVSAGTPRVTLASDDPGVAALGSIKTAVEILDNAIAGNEMQVDIVSGSVTANAGTNLNTSALALEAGGNLAAIATSLAIIDDWDSADACKIVGTGIAGTANAGVVTVQGIASMTPVQVSQATAANLNATVVGTGTFAVQAAQSGVWNVTNISGTVSLPTGAATAAKQPALGTAGTASSDVITVQGIASMTPILVTAQASTNTQEVVGDAAHGAVVAGNPLLQGLEGRSSDGTAVDSGDVVRGLASLLGKQVTLPHSLPGAGWDYASAAGGVTNTADVVAKTAAGVGSRNYVTSVQVVNGHATVSTEVVIKSAATIIWRGWAQAAGGGVSINFSKPLRGGDNEAINVTNITNGAATYFNVQGFSAAE